MARQLITIDEMVTKLGDSLPGTVISDEVGNVFVIVGWLPDGVSLVLLEGQVIDGDPDRIESIKGYQRAYLEDAKEMKARFLKRWSEIAARHPRIK